MQMSVIPLGEFKFGLDFGGDEFHNLSGEHINEQESDDKNNNHKIVYPLRPLHYFKLLLA